MAKLWLAVVIFSAAPNFVCAQGRGGDRPSLREIKDRRYRECAHERSSEIGKARHAMKIAIQQLEIVSAEALAAENNTKPLRDSFDRANARIQSTGKKLKRLNSVFAESNRLLA
ncbi:MAG: hypothetical protein R2827_12360 [Bdellovibrionales bacterium]